MVIILVLGGWLGWLARSARVQREVVSAVFRAGGRVDYDDKWRLGRGPKTIWAPRWMIDALGFDYFSSVSGVNFGKPGADAIAAQLARLGSLDAATFNGSDLGDEGLACLSGLGLRMLFLEGTQVTDDGLVALRGMANLERLDLFNAHVGDPGMAHVGALPGLIWLHLGQTRVTDQGLGPVGQCRGLKVLHLFGTRVGDPGATGLRSLTRLKELSLDRTRVTGPMIEELRSALPGATITPAAIETPALGRPGVDSARFTPRSRP